MTTDCVAFLAWSAFCFLIFLAYPWWALVALVIGVAVILVGGDDD